MMGTYYAEPSSNKRAVGECRSLAGQSVIAILLGDGLGDGLLFNEKRDCIRKEVREIALSSRTILALEVVQKDACALNPPHSDSP